MSTDKAQVTEIVFGAIGELNRELGKTQQLEKTLETVLTGEGGGLDSIAIVSFQMILEEKIGDALDTDVVLDFEQFVDSANTEPRTVDNLVDHLVALLGQGSAAS
jgi:acyl carrier protein